MRKIVITVIAIMLMSALSYAVRIGFFPGLDELIEKADAIVILRVDKHVTDFGSPTMYSTHDCYIYQTLKGDIPANKTIRLQLMDTRTSFVTPYAILSTHLMFLTKKRTADEPTDYRTIEFRGANIRLSPFGHEKMPEGMTTKEQIRSLLKRTVEYNKKQHDKEQAFLNKMIKGTADPQANNVELRMSIIAITPQKEKGIPVFRVTLKNVGDKDAMLNLGMMLANGRVLLPDAIRLILIDPDGKSRELHFADRRYPAVAGRVDDYAVPLRAGSAYTLRLSLGDFWCPKTNEFRLDLKSGAYRVRSELAGTGALCVNSDMEGMKLMNFWKGTLQSDLTVFRVREQG